MIFTKKIDDNNALSVDLNAVPEEGGGFRLEADVRAHNTTSDVRHSRSFSDEKSPFFKKAIEDVQNHFAGGPFTQVPSWTLHVADPEVLSHLEFVQTVYRDETSLVAAAGNILKENGFVPSRTVESKKETSAQR